MGWNAEQYASLLESLLPRGRMWPRGDTSTILYKILLALAGELSRSDNRGSDLVIEKNPSMTVELISDFETDLGLPETWADTPADYIKRISILLDKFLHAGSLCQAHYVEEIENYGYCVTLEFFRPFWSGIGLSGDPCGDQYVIFVFKVWINYSYAGAYSDAFDSGFDRLGTPSEMIRGLIDLYKPAYTRPLYSYGAVEFGMDYDNSFNSMPSQDPIWLKGEFDKSFDLVFDVCTGGGYHKDAFDWSFDLPL